ncbi:hypothetical protein KL921_001044 [Ogataea angusta]|uniref:RRM domain-containing protein n=1 Tax=Pichia angusta TaxID=870730 RepID=A0AAN6I6V9_PICAN|nr:uncharacterized protein KL928_001212 [Ogataea angusta]KAG7813498.1 hypothetical protein KL921_001044 [Ogataea angusta]KAG7821128.1 hypothetical protein KL928_001212 [Ogataea angusta]KAG7826171.1 hypothetical protein KL909_000223 [Ogataea angusta]KAG7832083.1 hypothetical protein KL920_000418 [Ogataea angusta]KAG7836255.1 hypothetical protein KL943_001904 [Ogataea angusta]
MSLFRNQFEFPIILVKNLPYDVKAAEMYEIFGKFGNIHEIRLGADKELKGQALVVYTNYKSCQTALDKMKGFNLNGRYIICSLYQVEKSTAMELREKMKENKQTDQ